jgi:hypothetical protein
MTDTTDTPEESDEQPTPWELTIGEARRLAAERKATGWDTVLARAGDTTVVTRAAGDDDRFGFYHLVSGETADAIAALSVDQLPEFRVYRRETDIRAYQVTELCNPERKTTVLVVGTYPVGDLAPVRETATATGRIYTRLFTLDRSLEFVFEHADPTPFFVEPGADGA